MKNAGFTLLELIITIAIVSILSAFAIPYYFEPQLKIQQSLAKTTLLELANAIEQEYTSTHSYQTINLDKLTYRPPSSDYKFILVKNSANTFTIAAIPKKKHPEDQCGIFYVDQDGNPSVSGTGSVQDCW
jgi:type IV pilus assembly protein PilE